jgi:IS1 family transposase/transposase-like protein
MVDTLLSLDLLLIALLWLGIILYEPWARTRAAPRPTTRQLATPLPQHSQNSKPFPGRTPKPHCALCEQAPESTSAAPLVPPVWLPSSQGRPRQVDTSGQFCPQPHCAYYGWVGRGNIRANGYPSGGRWRQFQCRSRQQYFLETHGTPLHGKRVLPEVLMWAVGALAEGLGIRAVARVFAVDPNTVLQWLMEVADQAAAFSRHFLHDVQGTQVQLDELFAVLSTEKAGEGSEKEAPNRLSPSPRWVWVALDPVTKLLLAIEVGERTLALAQRLVHQVAQVLAPGCVPLFLTDGFKEYLTAVLTHYGHWVQWPRRWATGRRPKPRWLPLPQLHYAQVVKKTRRRRLVAMSSRVVFGTLAGVKQILASTGWQINTAFVERVNLTIRQHVAAVGRRVPTVCKNEAGLRQQLAVYHVYYNFCLPHASLRRPLPQPAPTKGTGSAKSWRPCTPAMAAGLTDRVWTLREVLGFRVPPGLIPTSSKGNQA